MQDMVSDQQQRADIDPVETGGQVARRVKAIVGGSAGNLVEWYDWYTYSAFAVYFAKAFFPDGDNTAQLLQTAGVFALGFIMRPIGGLIMGVFADRYGRRNALAVSVLMMCFGSLMIALTPGYADIGVWAPIMLVVARLLQGLSIGGEYGASATYLSEMAGKKSRGFYSSFQYVTLIAGQLVALGVLLLLQSVFLTEGQLYAWGWRIPFLIGAVCALFALYIRRSMDETDQYLHVKNKEAAGSVGRLLLLIGAGLLGSLAGVRALMMVVPIDPLLAFGLVMILVVILCGYFSGLAKYPRAVAVVVGLTMGGTVAFYCYTIYMQKFLSNTVGFSKTQSAQISAATLFCFALLQPVFGAISDRIGRKPLLISFGVLGSLATVPLMTQLSVTTDPWMAFGLIMIALLIVSGYTSINAVVKAELFPTEIRALGVAFPYAVAVSLFGGTAEYIALWFKKHHGKAVDLGFMQVTPTESWFYWYVSGCIACSLLVYLTMRDTKKTSLIDRDL